MVRAAVKLLLLFALYLLLVGQAGTDELVAASLCAIAAAALWLTIPTIAERHFRFRDAPWHRILIGCLAALARDTLRVGAALARPRAPRGAIQRWRFAAGGNRPQDTARRGITTLAVSVAPNSYVLAVLTGRRELLVHRLAPAPTTHDTEWPL